MRLYFYNLEYSRLFYSGGTHENYIQNSELQNEQMKDENEVFNSFINVMVQIVEKYGKTVLQELDCAA